MGGRRSGIPRWVRAFLFALAVVFFFFFSFLILIEADKHYAWFRGVLVRFLKADNHFDGSLWFSTVATFIGGLISAVPGLMCGLLAYIQTERLHELEDRYHRPGLELDEAKVSIIVLRDKKGDLVKSPQYILGELSDMPYRYRRTVEEVIERQDPFYIVIKADFHVKNEVTVKCISVRQVDFLIGEEALEWVLAGKKGKTAEGHRKIWEFNKRIEQGQTKYTLEWILYPSKKKATPGFWYAMRDFVMYTDIRNPRFRDLEINVHMDVEYEYSGRSGTECILRVEFDGSKMQQVSALQENYSCNGYFAYDIRCKKRRFSARR